MNDLWSRRRTRALLLRLRDAVSGAVYPEGAGDASARRAFLDEARESDNQFIRRIVVLLVPLHVTAIAVMRTFHETDPVRVSWIAWAGGINAVLLGVGVLAGCVTWIGRPAVLRRVLGDFGGAMYLLGGAALAANAERVSPNVNIFVIAAFFTAFRMRMRPSVFVASLVAALAMVLAAMVRSPTAIVVRAPDYLTLLAASSLSLFAFFLTRGMRFRELLGRRQIVELNAQLNEKIRERSRELSMALAHLAEGHRDLDPGTVLGGRVELEGAIGRGGMGVVYRGRDLLTKREVAVKVVQAGSARELDGLYRFLREARFVASVTHPAIVRSIHVDVSDEGRLFQMMELVEGETLQARLARGGPLPPAVAARLGGELAEALAAAHAAGVVHLDVKPANVVLTRTKPGMKLLDFGISRLRDTRATSDGADERILGTPEFLSPEQVNRREHVDERADVYALGLVLYVAIAGRMPFDAASPPEWLLAHGMHPPLDLAKSVPEIDPVLAGVVMSCLCKAPGERPTAGAVASMLAALANEAEIPPLETLDLAAPRALPEGQAGAVLAEPAAVTR